MITPRIVTSSYAALRAAAALPAGVAMWNDRQEPLTLLAQLLCDAAEVSFLLALSYATFRNAVGAWWILILLYAVVWETVKLRRRFSDVLDPPANDPDQDSMQAIVSSSGGIAQGMYGILGVAFPLTIGFGLCCDVLFGTTFTSR